MTKLHKGDRVKVIRGCVVRMKPCQHQCYNKKTARSFNVEGYSYSKNPECEFCGNAWLPIMDAYNGKSFIVDRSHKVTTSDKSDFMYTLKDREGKTLEDINGDNIYLYFCQHWLKPIRTVISTNTNRINYVMQNDQEQVQNSNIEF